MWTFLSEDQLDRIREKLDEEHPSGLPGSTALSAAYISLPFYSNARLVRAVNQEHEANTFYFVEKDGAYMTKKGGDAKRQEIDQKYGVHLRDDNIGDYFRYIYFMANRQICEPLVERADDMRLDQDKMTMRERRAAEYVRANPLNIEKQGGTYIAKGVIYAKDGLNDITMQFRPGRGLEEVQRHPVGLTVPEPEFIDNSIQFRQARGNNPNPATANTLSPEARHG